MVWALVLSGLGVSRHEFPWKGRGQHVVMGISALLVAVRRPSWRVPALAMATVQFATHSINHLVDIAGEHVAVATLPEAPSGTAIERVDVIIRCRGQCAAVPVAEPGRARDGISAALGHQSREHAA